MSGLGWAVAGVGALIIVTRGPLIFAPVATIAAYRKLFASLVGIRVFGVAVSGMGLALVATAEGHEGLAASLVNALGWIVASAAIVLFIIAPNLVRSIAELILDLISDVARPIGVFAVALGALLIWFGVAVL